MLLPPPIQFISWIFLGCFALIPSGPFPGFSQVLSPPFYSHHFSSYSTCLIVLSPHLASPGHMLSRRASPCAILASAAHAPSRGIFPLCISPSATPPISLPGSPDKKTGCSLGDWKPRLSSLLRGTQRHSSPLEGSEAVPWSVWGAVS